jgi:hypothetical protein
LALKLQVRQGASSVERGLVGRVGGLSGLDSGDVQATAGRESKVLARKLA